MIEIAFFVAIVVIVVALLYFRHRENESRDRLLQTFVEKGQAIPDELLQGGRGRSSLSRGISMMIMGVALAIFFLVWPLGQSSLFLVGIFPFAVGLATIVGAFVERKLAKRAGNSQ